MARSENPIKAKQKHKQKILDYMGNPANDFLTRKEMGRLCFKNSNTLYEYFKPDELDEIEKEALDLRRAKYARSLNEVDKALIKKAKAGDSTAIKLCYQRFEDWAEVKRRELTGKDGKDLVSSVKIKLVQK